MMSVPPNWSELYFNIFAILCVIEGIFLVWYEITRRGEQSDYIEVAVNVIMGMGPVGLAAAIQVFVILKARDLIMMTWERYKQERFDRGKAEGREEGKAEGKAEGKVEGKVEGKEEGREETLRALRQVVRQENGAGGREDSEVAERIRAILRGIDEKK